MSNRLALQELLENVLGSDHVYYQPPASVRMEYDAIRYSLKTIETLKADNTAYKQNVAYELIAIYRNPDSDLPFKLASLPMCRFDRHYVADNLNHDVFTIYY